MPDPNLVAMRVIEGQVLSEEERSFLTPTLLAQLAIGGHLQLTDNERQIIPAALLANLALCCDLQLTRAERDRLPENLLAQLVIGGKTNVEYEELSRFSIAVQAIIAQV
jgi:hypothetical protein